MAVGTRQPLKFIGVEGSVRAICSHRPDYARDWVANGGGQQGISKFQREIIHKRTVIEIAKTLKIMHYTFQESV